MGIEVKVYRAFLFLPPLLLFPSFILAFSRYFLKFTWLCGILVWHVGSSSLTRDWTWGPLHCDHGVLATGPSWKSHLAMSLIIMTGWYLVGRGQGCYSTSSNPQVSPQQWRIIWPQMSIVLMTSLFPTSSHGREVEGVSSSPLPSPTEHGHPGSLRESAVIDWQCLPWALD